MALEYGPHYKLIDICGRYYQPYYYFMYLMALELDKDLLMVELGVETGRGLSALAMSGRKTIGIDHTRTFGVDKVLHKYSNVIFLEQDTLSVPEWFDNQEQKIGLLHIDTEHSYSMAKAEFEGYKHLLANPSVVIFDDLHAQENAVRDYFSELPYPKIQDDRLHPRDGWGVVLYNG